MKQIYILFFALWIGISSAIAQTEPTNQPTGFNFSSLEAYKVRVFYQTAGSGIKYLVLRSTSPITDVPSDNTTYTLGNAIGNSKIVGLSTNTSHTMRALKANTTYYFKIFAYNDGANPNYKTDNPLEGQVTTKGLEPENYYVLDAESTTFIDDLSDLLFSHTHLDYGLFDDLVVENIHEFDTLGTHAVFCEYSHDLATYSGGFDWTDLNYNREHMLPKAWMPSNPSGNNEIESSDYHNLALAYGPVNQKRSNFVVGEANNVNWAYEEATFQNSGNVFEPRDEFKGDLARALFYMVVCYDGKNGSWAFDDLQTFGDDQNVTLLRQWHHDDPVSNFEIAKHEYIAQIQGNRNPFVDNPQWVDCIDFTDLTMIGGCDLDTTLIRTNVAVQDIYTASPMLQVFPNPTSSHLNIQLTANESILQIELIALDGKVVLATPATMQINVSHLPKGLYILKASTSQSIYTQKVVID